MSPENNLLESSTSPTISKKITRIVGKTNAQYNLIKAGDKVLLGLSGGKDSILLATLLAGEDGGGVRLSTGGTVRW